MGYCGVASIWDWHTSTAVRYRAVPSFFGMTYVEVLGVRSIFGMLLCEVLGRTQYLREMPYYEVVGRTLKY